LPRHFDARTPTYLAILAGGGTTALAIDLIRLTQRATDKHNNAKARERKSAFHNVTKPSTSFEPNLPQSQDFLRFTSDAGAGGKAAFGRENLRNSKPEIGSKPLDGFPNPKFAL
jgi:hypothetical protein